MRLTLVLLLSSLALSGCAYQDALRENVIEPAKVTETTRSYELLKSLPPPAQKVAVAVYNFDDQTGQFKSNDKLTEYSSAVTKGGIAVLNNALLATGNKSWFTVVERNGLRNLLQERQIIRAMREQYQRPDGSRLPDLPPLVYAGMLIEGGIIGYDTNTLTGGLGANYFGIGGTSEYRSDTVTVFLRAINIQTGEVLISTTSSKTIYSMAVQGNVFRYLTVDRLLAAETGFTMNEPVMLAVRQAIETAVYSMVMEGAMDNLWDFANPALGRAYVQQYMAQKSEDNKEVPAPEYPAQQMPPAPRPLMPPPPPPAPVDPAPVEPMMPAPVSEAPLPLPAPEPVTSAPPVTVTPPPAAPTSQLPPPPRRNRGILKYLDAGN